jgi:hypothetical protein
LLPQLNLIGYIMTTHESIVEQFETYLKLSVTALKLLLHVHARHLGN